MTDKELYEEIIRLQESYAFTKVGHHVIDYALDVLLMVKEIRSEKIGY